MIYQVSVTCGDPQHTPAMVLVAEAIEGAEEFLRRFTRAKIKRLGFMNCLGCGKKALVIQIATPFFRSTEEACSKLAELYGEEETFIHNLTPDGGILSKEGMLCWSEQGEAEMKDPPSRVVFLLCANERHPPIARFVLEDLVGLPEEAAQLEMRRQVVEHVKATGRLVCQHCRHEGQEEAEATNVLVNPQVFPTLAEAEMYAAEFRQSFFKPN